MKIGILTFWWSQDNYGQLLQCYALQKYLRDVGHDAFLIRYDMRLDVLPEKKIVTLLKILNPKILYSYFQRKIVSRTVKKEERIFDREFDEFRNKYIVQSDKIYSSYEELKIYPPRADLYIVGSDQVWSGIVSPIHRFKNIVNAYFLNFGNKDIKRVSYAASWGTNEISNDYVNLITPLLKRFDHITVREQSGVNLCERCSVSNAVCVPDPTFLLSSEDYLNGLCTKEEKNLQKKYILLYMLNNGFSFEISRVFDWAKLKGLDVIYITGNGLVDQYQKTYATIPQWLNYIKNAEYIVTNSFHCSVFSMLFNKNYAVVPLTGKLKGLNTRLESLFALCGIQNRFIMDYDFSILEQSYNCDIENIKNKAQKTLGEIIK